jgi:hypothetical protein
MNEFVNFNHRDVSLSAGCKDLMDVLRAKNLATGSTPEPLAGFERVRITELSQLEPWLRRFLTATGRPVLTLNPPGPQVNFCLLRTKADPCALFHFFDLATQGEARVREIFAQLGIAPLTDAILPGTQQRVLFYLLPKTVPEALAALHALLPSVCPALPDGCDLIYFIPGAR